MEHIAYDFGVAPSTVSNTIMLVENTLIQDGTFHLPGKKTLVSKENAGRTLAVDVTESPIQRVLKKQKQWYSGKKKRHTIKNQVVIDVQTQEIIDTAQEKGAVHDIQLFKSTIRGIVWAIYCWRTAGTKVC